MSENEQVVSIAKAYLTDSSKVVVIPKKLRRKLGERNTDFFIVKLDARGRIILEPIIEAQQPLELKEGEGCPWKTQQTP